MVTTNNKLLSERIGSLRNHGASPLEGDVRPWSMDQFNLLGFNLRLSDIQAAVGLAQMSKLDALIAERRTVAERYNGLLADLEELVLPIAGDVKGHTYQSYVVRLRQGTRELRNNLMEVLEQAGIQTRPGTHAVHRLGYYATKYGLRADDFPSSAACEDTTVTLPIFPGMTEGDQRFVVLKVQAALRAVSPPRSYGTDRA